jgi:2-hydroxychromene-2-carboxylate isomerase
MNCDCGRALAAPAEGREREAYEAGRLAGYEYGIDLGMGESFTPAAPAEGLDVERLARAIRTAEVRSQMGAQRMGAVPPDDGPLPDWYRAYAEDVAREYAALKRRPTDD